MDTKQNPINAPMPHVTPCKAWLLATRPKTLTAALIPVIVGTTLASTVEQDIQWSIAFFALLCAFCIQIGTNYINDALDFKKGADTATRVGPLRATQSGVLKMKDVYYAGLGAFGLALLFGIPLIIQGGFPIFFLLIISVICGYLYTGGPAPLAYHGLGDIFVLLFFGIVSTSAVFFLQTHYVDDKAILAGTQVGLLATVLIAVNNLRDRQEDAKVNKRTLAVRFGVTFARYEIALCVLLPFFLNMLWFQSGYVPAGMFPWLALPLAIKIICYIWQMEPGPIYNRYLAQAALLHLLFGLCLSMGFLFNSSSSR
jgi:1,4-dihydroxy-2-naphthoate octaprenyltransferase